MESPILSKLFLKYILVLTVLLIGSKSFSQSKIIQVDTEFQRLVEKGALTADQASNYLITAQHTSKTSGIQHIYFSQAINGLQVNGTESSIHLLNGKKIKYNENLLIGDAFRVNGNSSPGITAEQAIRSISQTMAYKISNLNEIERKSGINQEIIFNSAGISKKDIPTKLVYQITENNEIKLVWEVIIEDINTNEDWWVFAVNASNGSIIKKHNLYDTCNITDEHNDHFHSGVSPKTERIIEEKIDYSAILKVSENNESSIMAGTYNVYALPDESPLHGTVGRTSVSNPEGPGSPFGWHDTNGVSGAESTLTTGNNVDAHKGSFRPDGGAGLVFNYPINLAVEAPTDYVDVAATNLFYWSNIVHDVLWEYGFDEAARNFQENNYGNGGAGSDSVNANVQASGNCNANFGTPSDGSNPTMNMFICNIANPDRDGDFDNGVVIHEYGHGISNRLTGGASVNCLQNSEQMGEGWSDFYGLVMTMNVGDVGTAARGMGTYLLGEPANGSGIRVEPYSTDMGIYTQTYANVNGAVIPHGVGEIWANMLWEMTWGLIADHGFDTDIYNFTGNVATDKGNVMALALVTEGLKLQPCSPGFVDGRDAIIAADLAIYGGANACTIWDAFAKRGLGFSASQGSSSSTSDQIVAFDLPPGSASFDTPLATICETQGTQTGLSGGAPAGGTYTGIGVTDNLDGTFDFDPTIGGLGNTTVTYTVLNGCSGAIEGFDDTIIVTDGLPVLVCKDITVVLDGGGNATITESDVIDNLTPFSLTTTFASNNGQAGNMFDLMAVNDITINSFDVNMDTGVTADVAIYFKTGTWVGSDTTPGDWTLMATASAVTSAGIDQSTALNLSMGIDVLAGNTVAFYVTLVNNVGINYVNGSNVGNEWASDANLVVYEGAGKVYPFSTTFQPRNFSGNVVYKKTDQIGLPDNCGNVVSASLSQTAFTCEDIGDVIVTVTADDGNGGISMCNATVTVEGTTSTFASGAWDVAPNTSAKALFQDSYNTETFGDVTACSCEIEPGNTVTVNPGGFLDIVGNILVEGTLDVLHEGSVVQRVASAVTTNNGTITVTKTTTPLNDVDFSILGSPMTGETREGVYGGSAMVRHHITGNFVPNPQVAIDFPFADNFADDNGDNWQTHIGNLMVGEGYLVRPFPLGETGGEYTTVYTQGTLNNGPINFIAEFNTPGPDAEANQNASPNILSNPYASSLDAFVFITDNDIVDAIYYWEHITAPNVSYPGYSPTNYNMGDISMYNLMGGMSATNEQAGLPLAKPSNQFIPSGQGFGIKAFDDGTGNPIIFDNTMRLTTNNDGYRNSEIAIERLYLSISNNTYGLKGGTLIAFTELATDGFDRNYDAKRLATPISLFSISNDRELGIQGRSAFNEEHVIPLGFSTQVEENQEYTISINSIEGEQLSQATVYLIDNLLTSRTNLSETDYSFSSNEGDQSNRFVLVFESTVLGNQELGLDAVSIYPNPTNKTLNIISPRAAISSVIVFDVQGREVNSINMNNQGLYQIDMSSFASAIYFVKINTDSGSILKKVVKE